MKKVILMLFFICQILLVMSSTSAEQYTCPVHGPVSVAVSSEEYSARPNVDGASRVLLGGGIKEWASDVTEVTSPIID